MKKPLIAIASGLAAASLMLGSSSAFAGPRVDWSISIGAPGYYAPAPYVQPYAAPYVQPYGVYSPPPAVYAASAPVYVDPYYAYRVRAWREREWRRQQWREMHWRRHQMYGYGY